MSKFGPWYIAGQLMRARATTRGHARQLSADEAARLTRMTPAQRQTYIAIKEGRLARDGTIIPQRSGGCGLFILLIVGFILFLVLVSR